MYNDNLKKEFIMPDQKLIYESILNEINDLKNKDAAAVIPYLVEKLSELYALADKYQTKIELMQAQLEHSELFFSLPEVLLMSRSKLPYVLINAGDLVPPGENFYEAEAYGGVGHIRWTGPDRINNFHVPVDRSSERIMRLKIAAAIKPQVITSIKLYIDGQLITYEIEQQDNMFELIATLPVVDRVQDTLISLFVPYLFSPADVDTSSSDNRRLGVAFHQLEVM
ncbi:MAG: hypothetical protein CL691_00080 [Cellvibrionales bacterium]|nr:hypothetical protein [Cellvibrionales bacterium]|tara:strand:+ start:840 stop:1514 length:675 start_codon:yes stop_codon:yes gene_type:complete